MLIDTAKSFVLCREWAERSPDGTRLSGLSPNLTSRFTPGTLISSYEVFEALRRGGSGTLAQSCKAKPIALTTTNPRNKDLLSHSIKDSITSNLSRSCRSFLYLREERTPINLPRLLISKSLYTNTTIIWYGFFYYLDVTRA